MISHDSLVGDFELDHIHGDKRLLFFSHDLHSVSFMSIQNQNILLNTGKYNTTIRLITHFPSVIPPH